MPRCRRSVGDDVGWSPASFDVVVVSAVVVCRRYDGRRSAARRSVAGVVHRRPQRHFPAPCRRLADRQTVRQRHEPSLSAGRDADARGGGDYRSASRQCFLSAAADCRLSRRAACADGCRQQGSGIGPTRRTTHRMHQPLPGNVIYFGKLLTVTAVLVLVLVR